MIEALLPIGLLVVVAKLVEGVLSRIGLNSIVAFTATGILLGPIAGMVEPTDEIHIFLGIGVFVLFFLVGLDEIDIAGFVATIRGRFFLAATVSVLISLWSRWAKRRRIDLLVSKSLPHFQLSRETGPAGV